MSRRDYLKHLGFATSAAIVTANQTKAMSNEPTIEQMTKEDYRQFELLLGKLQTEIGNKICIIPGYIQDGYHVGVYSSKSGEPITSATGYNIETVVERLKQQSNEQTK
jgi:hypothetical protein